MCSGYILLSRTLTESEIFHKPAEWLKVWIYILQKVNFKDAYFERGENFFNMQDIARDCGVSYNSVNKFLVWARKNEMLATRKTTRGVVIKVLGYAKYQDPNFYESNTESKTEAKQKQNRSNTIKEEGKNERMKEDISKDISRAAKASLATEDDFLIAKRLFAMLYSSNPAFCQKFKNLSEGEKTCRAWSEHISKMKRIDNREYDQIGFVIDWIGSPDGEFWQSNIMSGKKLREKYDTLVGQMKRKPKQVGRTTAIIS